jgi:hypothetical protein
MKSFISKLLLVIMALFLVVGAAHADYNSDAAARQAGEWIGSYGVAASGDILYLADYNTLGQPRANTLDIQSGSTNSVTLKIIPLVEDASGNVARGWFSSADDAENVTVSHNISTSLVTLGTPTGMYDSTNQGWYCSIVATANGGSNIGPDSYRVTYNPNGAYGDFSLVITDLTDPDSGYVENVAVEYYEADQTTYFAKGTFDNVDGSDDEAIAGANGRSYATALDVVAHGVPKYADIIDSYTKYEDSQILETVTDLNGIEHPVDSSDFWLYGVYYSPDGVNWNRDDAAEIIGPDDYYVRNGARILWKLTDSYDPGTYDTLFPATLP